MFGVVILSGTAYAQENLDLTADDVVSGTATNFENSIGQPVEYALLQCTDNTLHFTLDGTDPTAAAGTNVGIEMSAGNTYVIEGVNNVRNFKCTNAVAGADSIPKLIYFTRG